MKAAIFDFRNLDDEFQQAEMNAIKSLQWQIWIAQEVQEQMTRFLYEKKKKTTWSWLSRTLFSEQHIANSCPLIVSPDTFEKAFQQSVHAVVLLHNSQQLLKEWLMREAPDMLVITTDTQDVVCGVYQQTQPSESVPQSPKQSDCGQGNNTCSEP